MFHILKWIYDLLRFPLPHLPKLFDFWKTRKTVKHERAPLSPRDTNTARDTSPALVLVTSESRTESSNYRDNSEVANATGQDTGLNPATPIDECRATSLQHADTGGVPGPSLGLVKPIDQTGSLHLSDTFRVMEGSGQNLGPDGMPENHTSSSRPTDTFGGADASGLDFVSNGGGLDDTKHTEFLSYSANAELWDLAYQKVRKIDCGIVKAYEDQVSRLSQGGPNRAKAVNPGSFQVGELVQRGLEETDRSLKTAMKVTGAVLYIVKTVKNLGDVAVQANPIAALAWAGVSCALGVRIRYH